MPPGAPACLALALGLGLWLGALAGDPRPGCGPCPSPCLCGSAPDATCRVNCSGRWLQTLGPALRIPVDATALDLSHNLLQTLDVELLINLSALVELDLSNNRISTLEEGIFANLFNLSEINLSGNPFECNCDLAWLPRWLEEQQVRVLQSEATTCRGPIPLAGQSLLSVPLSDSTCGEEYIACLPDNSSGAVAVVAFSAHEGPLEPEACSAFCFSVGEGLAALSVQSQCLCGTSQPSNTSVACLSWCSSITLSPTSACGGPTLIQHVFPASPGATLVGPHGPLASGWPADFHITAPMPISSTRWDFGDGSPEVDMAGPTATHSFLLPGRYHVTAVMALGAGSALLETEAQVEVAPTALELVCPSSVHSNESLELSIRHRGGSALEVTYSILALDKEPIQVVHPLCPSDTEIFPGNGHCYRLVAEKASWLQAQEQCRTWAGAALAMVDSPAIQNFLVSQVTRSLDVWIGFSTLEGAEGGPTPQGEAFNLESCQNWLPGEPHPATAEHCVRLGPAGQCNTDLCSAPHSYVCELRPGGPMWDAENLLVGVPGRGLPGPLHLLAQQEVLLSPQQPVEVMVFPGLSPSREAFLTAAKFETQELGEPAQLRLQVYRPSEGTEVATEDSSKPDNRTELVPKCVPKGHWCPGVNVCVPFDASCQSHACTNRSMSEPGFPRASYVLWKEFLFSVPAGPPTQYLVTFHGQDIPVFPGDLVGLQHDAGPGALLHCPLASSCPGLALYLSTNASDWLVHLPTQLEEAWAGPACSLQLLLATEQLSPLLGLRPNSGLQHSGRYEVRATVGNSVSRYNLSCSFDVVSPVTGLRVIHPVPLEGHLYVPTNGSVLVLQLDSGANATATAHWSGGNISAPFEAACPPVMDTLKLHCNEETNGTLFSVLLLPRLREGEHAMEIMAQNGVNQANLSLKVTAEEPIYGLRAMPSPEARVLQGILVRYNAMAEAGSDVAFRWTIDDKQSLTFHNAVFNVIYQSAAIFKLSLTASNHVSNVTVNYNVTVERMNRMRGLWVSAVPSVLPPNATLVLMGSVLVDSAVEVTFLWTFGDGKQALSQYKPPYDESFQVPDPTVAQVLVEHNTTHIYTTPGEYNLTVLVSNTYENLTQQVPVSVRPVLPNVAVGMSSNVLVAGQPITFSPHPLPSAGGVLYTWDFGDGSPVLTQSQPALNHTYTMTGIYRIILKVNNTVSCVVAHADIHVFQELRGLTVCLNPSVEQGAPMVVSAAVESGDNVTWTFDMGDGTVFIGPEATVQHVYLRAQNSTVTVGAASPVGYLTQSLLVQVFVLEVLRIEPATCIPIQPNAQLIAHVTGDPAHYLFDWTFGDGSSNTTIQGYPVVTHNFTQSGIFSLALVLSSQVNKAHYFTSVCVEPEVYNVTLQPERQFVQLGDEARLVACSWPPFPYRYIWDFGTEDTTPTQTGGSEVTFIYQEPGSYLVTVMVSNNVSATNDSAFVEVQEPLIITGIGINGSHVLELQQPYLFSAMGHGRPATYLWELGDGNKYEGPEITHIYNSTGEFTVRVAGWNEVSHSEAQLNVTVKLRVRGLTINASRTVVPLNGSVSFSTSLEAGTDVRYSWVLCDRCTPIPGGPTISYTFRSVGTFNIIVTAENEVGSAQDSIFIYVLQFIEGLQVVGGGGGCCFPTNHTLQLQAVVKDGTNISYSWTVQQDDGPTLSGSGKNFLLIALKAGTYHIYLRATNMLGSASANRTMDFVEPVGYLIVAASPNPAAVNVSLTLDAELSGGSSVVYTWSVEDGLSWETSKPSTTHAFATAGLHLVRVTAGNQLSSVNATIEVAIQVPVGGLSIRTGEPDSFVAAGSTVHFWSQLATGTNVSWCWTVLGGNKHSQHIAVGFPTAGSFSVQLNASNAVSWVSATYNLTVEEPIVGLVLWASSKVVAPGQPVHFQIIFAAGSAVIFRLQVGGMISEVLPGPQFSHSFFWVGDHMVNVQAENHVSHAQAQVHILVLEPIDGLQVPNCCEPGMATGTEKNFTARVQRGSRVAYAWYFSLQKVQGDSLVILSGRDVTYTPVAAGLLEIHVRAFNELGGVNLTLMVEVQDIIQYVTLQSGHCFTNRSARFEAVTSPSPRRVAYHWDFGDGTPVQDTEESWTDHSYLHPGDYHVEVNATNLVSFFVAQATVTVQVLACREPEVEVALPLQVLMRRSQRNYLEAHVDLRNCVTYQTKYRWEVYRTASCQRPGHMTHMILPGVDVSRPQLVLPRLALPVGHYCFVFVVSFGDTPLARSIQANVTMAAERLVPIIEGGSYRVWSDTQDLVLDGSKSYDPNLEDGDQTPLSFHWACVASTQSEAGVCVLNFGPRGSSVVTIPMERLEAGVEYTFNLTVWKAGRKEEATNQTVLIRSGRVPIVSLECVSCKAQAVYEVSRSSYVYLEGRCHNCSSGFKRGRWAARTFSNKTLVLDKTTTSTGSSGMRLVVRQGALHDGEGYIFTLTVLGRSGEEEGCASIRLSPNRPPLGGSCRLFPLDAVHGLTTKVYFECTGWHDAEDGGAPLVYALLLRRCRQNYCEDFCIYKGSLSTYGAVLPPGFWPLFEVVLAVVVQDQLGAAVVALNRSLAIVLPEPNGSPADLIPWLHSLTASVLPGLLRQADPQHVIEYSLALITVLNEYEQAPDVMAESNHEWQLRAQMRKNITETLVSLRVNTVDDIQQITAALAQCMVSSRELMCRSCLKRMLQKLEDMMCILQAETTEGTMTPTTIADSILNITGDLIHLASLDVQGPQLGAEPPSPSLMVASKAYNLSSALMCILMRSRVLNEEPLTLAGEEILALGKRSDPLSLLCYGKASGPDCHFSIPEAFSGALSNLSDVVQLIFLVDSNPFPFGYISNYTVSTKVASMAFQTQAGTQIPIEQLATERAITVKVPNNSDQAIQGSRTPVGSAVVQPQASVSAVVTADNNNPEAGLHMWITYTVLDEHYLSEEPEPYLAVYMHSVPQPNEYNYSSSRRISLEVLEGADHRPYTFFIAPGTGALDGNYYLNLTNHFHWSALEVSVGLYTSLCQYFSEEKMMWRTEGLVPLEETSPNQAVCLTRHLTAFGASLFVPPSHVRFVFPKPTTSVNYIVLLTCAMCLVTYAVMAVILRKMDQLDVRRVRVIPFCGKGGRFKYEILVKTGWGRGSGTTAHVGIMLYGEDNRSGHRHLDGDRAFHRNSLDIFQIATPYSLGSVWKIRVWHDNKGLSPAWFLQYIIVRDLQSARSTFFLVNDWLSVETEANGGLVEKEVLAASDTALWQFRRLLVAELQRGFFDKHIWLSVWDRPPRSRFTRVQRATCCVLLLCLFLAANAVWYGVVGDANYSVGPVSSLIPPSVDTVAIGLVSSVVVYPVYLAVLFLFRMSRSKVARDQSPMPGGQQALDIDSYLDPSVLDSSFLTFSGLHTEAFAGQVRNDLLLEDAKSLVCWPSSEGTLSWPDLLSDPSIVGSTLQRLAQGHMLGPEEDGLSLVSPSSPAKYLSASDEDLIRQVLADRASNVAPTQDAHIDSDLLTSLSSAPGEKTETLMLQTLGEKRLYSQGLTWEQSPMTRLSRTGLPEGLRKRLLPAWCAPLAHGLSLLLIVVAVGISGWVGASFSPSMSVMWLLSSTSSFLASFLGWEPLKVLLEALYFSLVAKRLHPDEDDTLVESPAVTPVSERVPRVRPPHGFALFLAKEEARKVKRLHDMLKSLLVYMLFLLVTLLANYGDASCHGHAYRLQSAIKQELDSRAFLAITRSDEFWPWMSHVFLPYIHGNQSSPELGPPRLRQVRMQEALCPDPRSPVHTCSSSGSFSTSDYGIGWQSMAQNGSKTWAYSAPDFLGTWYWGYCAVYDSGGYVQELGLSLEESRARLGFLQLHNWLDSRLVLVGKSRAVFVELTRYSPAVGLHAAVTLRLEFPVAGHALAAFSVRPFALRRLSTGLSLPLLTSVCLLLFALYFSVAEVHIWRKEGCTRTAQPGAWARWLLVALTTATGMVRLAQLGIADRQWTRFVHGRPHHFTSFDQVAQLGSVAGGLAASLLFLLLVKAAQQLRFVRQWSVFGKTLCRALPELMGATLGLVVLGVAYAQVAVLLISSSADTLHNMARAFLVLCPGTRVPTLCPAESWYLSPLLCVGLWALRVWGALRLGAILLRWRYHALRGELYRPAWEPQDYEMVELFLRRLRLWMGFSKVKEFRHKVRFEGMEPLPSRSSRGSKSSPVLPPPSAGSDASNPSTSSSQLDGLSAVLSRSALRQEPEPSRLHSVFETLLAQFDRLNQATEDVYQLEQQLQSFRGHGLSGSPPLPPPGYSPGSQPALPCSLVGASWGIDQATGPSRASLWPKNKVHPSST